MVHQVVINVIKYVFSRETTEYFIQFRQTLGGPFSAVSTATRARVGAFFHIFRDLQDLQSFAPLRSQNLS